jgi:hypothetical protein
MRGNTIYLAKGLGLFMIILCAWGMFNRAAGIALIDAMVRVPGLQLTYAMITLAIGIAMILAHNFRGPGALTLVVTVVGWLIAFKGLVLLLAPGAMFLDALKAAGFPQAFPFVLALPLALGLYLTVAGFMARPPERG